MNGQSLQIKDAQATQAKSPLSSHSHSNQQTDTPALTTVTVQIKDFLGMGVPGHLPPGVTVPPEFLDKVGDATNCGVFLEVGPLEVPGRHFARWLPSACRAPGYGGGSVGLWKPSTLAPHLPAFLLTRAPNFSN